MRNTLTYCRIFLFAIVLFGPLLIKILGLGFDEKLSENKADAKMPSMHFDFIKSNIPLKAKIVRTELQVRKYMRGIEKYQIENLPFRMQFFRLFKSYKQTLAVQMLPAKVLKLKDWLFMGNQFRHVVEYSKGIKTLSDYELNLLRNNLESRQDASLSVGSHYYACVTPNKHTYKESHIPIKKKETAVLIELLMDLETNVTRVNLGKDFSEDKGQLYHKLDSHWNSNGAWLGYKTMLNNIKQDFPSVVILSENNLQSDTLINQRTDLLHFLKSDMKESQVFHLPLSTNAELNTNEVQLNCLDDLDKRPFHYKLAYKNDKAYYKALVFRDSYCRAMMPYINESFGEVLYIYDAFREDIVMEYKPDIVIDQFVERNLLNLIGK